MSAITMPLSDRPAAWSLPYRGKVAMASLILAESAIFTIFVVAYLFYLGKNLTGPTPREVLEPPIFFTICLLSSSLTIHLAAKSLASNRKRLFLGLWLLFFHVSLSWRRVLPRWLTRLGTTGTRTFRISVQDREWCDHNPGWAVADAGRPDGENVYGEAAMRMIAKIGEWFDQRLQLAAPIREAVEHPIPRNTASWWYVFGSAALTVFLLQLVTGILLALIYVPSAGEAWNSLQALNNQVALGWFIRAMHGWGSNFMVAIVLIHMAQVFLFGAYKFPRELTWIVGVFLLLMTLGMAFSGQVLRFDQDAYWGLGIGASIASRVPLLGPAVVKLMLGGPIIAGATLSRFFALHVFVIPGLIIAFVGLHLLMVLKLGINEWPMPGRIVKRSTYKAQYHTLTQTDGAPFVPYGVWKDMFFAGSIVLAIAALAAK